MILIYKFDIIINRSIFKMSDLSVQLRHAKRNNETKLDLSNKYITFIPNEVFSLVSLEFLNISKNKISSIDPKIQNLVNLKSLDLSDNSLMEIIPEFLKLSKLQVLNLSGNPLIKKFDPILKKDANVAPRLQRTLKQCFGLQTGEEQSKQKPSWLESQTESSSTSKVFSKMIEIQTLYKNEQNKVRQLERQLEKLSANNKIVKNKSGINLQSDSILEIQFNQLKIYQQISMGGFSVIHRGQYKGLQVAIKKVFNPNITQQLLSQLGNEVNMLCKFRHPNIILMTGICSIPPNLCIVMEYMRKGSLYDLLHKQRIELKQGEKTFIVRQIVDVLYYLHAHNIVHRDIKSHNFLIDQKYSIKLCDFGLAKNKKQLNTGAMQFSGTPIYMAPELFMKKGYDSSIDVFALGTLLYEIYGRQIPYTGLDPSDIKDKILKDSSLPSKISIKKNIMNLINKCRQIDPSKRPTMKQLKQFDEW